MKKLMGVLLATLGALAMAAPGPGTYVGSGGIALSGENPKVYRVEVVIAKPANGKVKVTETYHWDGKSEKYVTHHQVLEDGTLKILTDKKQMGEGFVYDLANKDSRANYIQRDKEGNIMDVRAYFNAATNTIIRTGQYIDKNGTQLWHDKLKKK